MDNGNKTYEVIDGLQRLTAISNFILGNNWGSITNDVQRSVPARLSSNIDSRIANKSFKDLEAEQQKAIKRSTVTVIDFRQIGSMNEKGDAKYLIFERINTGSELLNAMQIRKALAYGSFITSLYKSANESQVLRDFYSKQHLNKDRHVEFLLGVYVTYKILANEFQVDTQYHKYLLNSYCEVEKHNEIDGNFVSLFNEKLEKLLKYFNLNEVFKKINSEGKFHGNRSSNIAESLLATAILEDFDIKSGVVEKYKKYIHEELDKFIVNTVTESLLRERYNICKKILEK